MKPVGQQRPRSRFGALALTASLLAFLAFAGNVLYGKLATLLGWDPGLRFERVAEFLLLFSSASLFVIAALAAERHAGVRPPAAPPLEEDDNHDNRLASH